MEKHKANLVAEIYRELRNRGIDCVLRHRINNLEIDLAVVRNNVVLAILEIKRNRQDYLKQGAQISRYMNWGIPILLVVGYGNIQPAVMAIQKIWDGGEANAIYRFV